MRIRRKDPLLRSSIPRPLAIVRSLSFQDPLVGSSSCQPKRKGLRIAFHQHLADLFTVSHPVCVNAF